MFPAFRRLRRADSMYVYHYILDFETSRGVVVLLQALERMVWSSKLYENTTGIRQEGHPELKKLHRPSKRSGSGNFSQLLCDR